MADRLMRLTNLGSRMAGSLLALALAASAEAADLRVELQGVSGSGKVYAAVFKSAEGFPGKVEKAVAGAWVALPLSTVVFGGLAPGEYAVTAFHDQNGNEKLDTNALGIPVEPAGFSRDATGFMGPPKFPDAAVKLEAAGATIRINLR